MEPVAIPKEAANHVWEMLLSFNRETRAACSTKPRSWSPRDTRRPLRLRGNCTRVHPEESCRDVIGCVAEERIRCRATASG
jgi:hypothetical protein